MRPRRHLFFSLLSIAWMGCQASAAVPGASCARTSDCVAPLTCRIGRCRNECVTDHDCTTGLRCVRVEAGLGACTLAVEEACTTDVCAPPLVCANSLCRTECARDDDCLAQDHCVMSVCVVRDAQDAGASDADPPQRVEVLVDGFEDGDYMSNPTASVGTFGPDGSGSRSVTVAADATHPRALRILRQGTGGSGGGTYVDYDLSRVTIPPGAALHARVSYRIVADTLTGGGRSGCVEFPVILEASLGGGVARLAADRAAPGCTVPASTQLEQVGPGWDTMEGDLSALYRTENIRDAADVSRIRLSAQGWEYESWFDDLEVWIETP